MQSFSQQKHEDKLCHSKLFMCNPREMVQDKKLQISALRPTLNSGRRYGLYRAAKWSMYMSVFNGHIYLLACIK